jgi:transposase
VVSFVLLAPLFALVACGPLGSTLEEDTPLAGAGNLKDRGLVITVSRVVDGDTVEVDPDVDDLAKVSLIGVDTPETSGKPREVVARTFSVSMPTIKRWQRRRRETGDVKPKPIPGRSSRKGVMLREWLPQHLEANDDLTLEEHRQAFEEEFGQRVSTSTIGRAIAGLPNGGWPLKKRHR